MAARTFTLSNCWATTDCDLLPYSGTVEIRFYDVCNGGCNRTPLRATDPCINGSTYINGRPPASNPWSWGPYQGLNLNDFEAALSAAGYTVNLVGEKHQICPPFGFFGENELAVLDNGIAQFVPPTEPNIDPNFAPEIGESWPGDWFWVGEIVDGCWTSCELPVLNDLTDDCGNPACDRLMYDIVEYPASEPGCLPCPIPSRALGCAGCITPDADNPLGTVAFNVGVLSGL